MYNYGSNASDVIANILVSSFFVVYLIFFLVFLAIMIAFVAFVIICNWKLLEKAGEPGWKAIIPFYNYYTMADISLTKPTSLVVFIVFTVAMVIMPCSAVPWVGIVIGSIIWLALMAANGVMNFGTCKAFGRDVGVCVCGIFFAPIVRAILAFSKNIEYTGDKLTIFPSSNN